MDKERVVYAIYDPYTFNPVYVGITINIVVRSKMHLKAEGNTEKDKWIRALRDKAIIPEIKILETCSFDLASARESYYMVKYIKMGYNLFNCNKHHWAMTTNTQFDMRLDLQGLIKQEAKNMHISTSELINSITELYFKQNGKINLCDNCNPLLKQNRIYSKEKPELKYDFSLNSGIVKMK